MSVCRECMLLGSVVDPSACRAVCELSDGKAVRPVSDFADRVVDASVKTVVGERSDATAVLAAAAGLVA